MKPTGITASNIPTLGFTEENNNQPQFSLTAEIRKLIGTGGLLIMVKLLIVPLWGPQSLLQDEDTWARKNFWGCLETQTASGKGTFTPWQHAYFYIPWNIHFPVKFHLSLHWNTEYKAQQWRSWDNVKKGIIKLCWPENRIIVKQNGLGLKGDKRSSTSSSAWSKRKEQLLCNS